jgi:hypothetical protein
MKVMQPAKQNKNIISVHQDLVDTTCKFHPSKLSSTWVITKNDNQLFSKNCVSVKSWMELENFQFIYEPHNFYGWNIFTRVSWYAGG